MKQQQRTIYPCNCPTCRPFKPSYTVLGLFVTVCIAVFAIGVYFARNA